MVFMAAIVGKSVSSLQSLQVFATGLSRLVCATKKSFLLVQPAWSRPVGL